MKISHLIVYFSGTCAGLAAGASLFEGVTSRYWVFLIASLLLGFVAGLMLHREKDRTNA